MDLAALKNLDIKDLLNKIKGAGLGNILQDKKILIKFGLGFGSILIFLIIYYVFVSPVISEQKAKINIMDENQNKIDEYLANIDTLEASVKKLEPKYKKSSKLFHSRKEFEDLYQNITNFAAINGLKIASIAKGEPQAIEVNQNPEDVNQNPEDANQNPEDTNQNSTVLYYKIPVTYKISGNYLGYLKFRRALSKSKKVINFDKEIITVEAASGNILSEGTISIVGLPNEYKK